MPELTARQSLTTDQPVPKPDTPTLDKMHADHPCDGRMVTHSNGIGEFLDWLNAQGIHLVKDDERFKAYLNDDVHGEDGELIGEEGDPVTVYIPINEGPSALLHRYYDIDGNAEDREKRAILDYIRTGYPK